MATKKKGVVTVEGYLKKKRPKGLSGFKSWQTRYFVVDSKAITYYKAKGSEQLGIIPIFEIQKLEYLPDRRTGSRFDIVTKNGRVYACDSDADDPQAWIDGIRYAVKLAKDDSQREEKRESIIPASRKVSPLALLFYNSFFSEAKMTKTGNEEEESKVMAEIDSRFPGDVQILRELLLNYLDETKGYFSYEIKEEANEANAVKKALSLSSTVQELLDDIGSSLGVDLMMYAAKFEAESLFVVKDVQTKGVPQGLPKRLTATVNERLEAAFGGSGGAAESESSEANVIRVVNMLKSKEIVRCLTAFFDRECEPTVQSLAVRTIWCVYHSRFTKEKAAEEFNSQISIHCCGDKMTMEIMKALKHLLVASPKEIVADLEPYRELAMRTPLVQPQLWKGVLGALVSCKLEIREKALVDVNALLWDNLPNCEMLRSTGEDWQSWFFSLFVDLEKSKLGDKTLTKTVQGYLLNSLTLVHFEYFNKTDQFSVILNETVGRLHWFGGSNEECCTVAAGLLIALANKLGAKKNLFTTSTLEEHAWRNLFEFLSICKKFVFCSSYWQSEPYLGLQVNAFLDEEKAGWATSGSLSTLGSLPGSLSKSMLGGVGERSSVTLMESLDENDDKLFAPSGGLQLNTSDSLSSLGGAVNDKSSLHNDKGSFQGAAFRFYTDTCLLPSTSLPADFEYLLRKKSPDKKERTWFSKDDEIKDYGVHWTQDEPSVCLDTELVTKLNALLKALRILDIDPSLENITEKSHLDTIARARKEVEFWMDAEAFLKVMQREAISEKKIFTYRQFSYLCQKFSNSESRQSRFQLTKKLQHMTDGSSLGEDDDDMQRKSMSGSGLLKSASLSRAASSS